MELSLNKPLNAIENYSLAFKFFTKIIYMSLPTQFLVNKHAQIVASLTSSSSTPLIYFELQIGGDSGSLGRKGSCISV